MRALLLIILITLPFQIKKCNTILPQTDDVESSITIRTQAKAYFLVQLYRGFAEDGTYTKFLHVKKDGKTVANIVFPSSEDCKNLSVYIRKHKGGFLLKCLYGGGDDIYSRSCYFKCANEDLYLYEVVGTHEIPNSNKKVTKRKNIQPQISIGSFDILCYLENTP